jgi:hypothetical protein
MTKKTVRGKKPNQKLTRKPQSIGPKFYWPTYPFKERAIWSIRFDGKQPYDVCVWTHEDFDILEQAMGKKNINLSEVRAYLAKRCNIQNPELLSKDDIVTAIRVTLEQGQSDIPDLLPLKEVVKYFYTTTGTLKLQIKKGDLRDYRKPKKRNHVVSLSEVAKYHERKPQIR